MVSFSVKKDLLKLVAFLEGPEYRNGHPDDTELKALVEALKNLADCTAGARALAAIKTALGVGDEAGAEAGWLVRVLHEHKDDDEFEDAMTLCDRISDDLKHVTADCGGVAADYVVNWKRLPPMVMGDDPTDEPFLELDAYSVIGVDLAG